jgi:putative FmdB family regulatory protein
MPLYEYRCRDCDHRFEVLQRVGDTGDGLLCPACGAREPARQLSTFAAGSGTKGASAAVGGGCGAPACGTGFT